MMDENDQHVTPAGVATTGRTHDGVPRGVLPDPGWPGNWQWRGSHGPCSARLCQLRPSFQRSRGCRKCGLIFALSMACCLLRSGIVTF